MKTEKIPDAPRRNTTPGPCSTCGQWVSEGAGKVVRAPGDWYRYCQGCATRKGLAEGEGRERDNG